MDQQEMLAHVMWVGKMAFQNSHKTTEGCGLVDWAGRHKINIPKLSAYAAIM